MLKKKSTIHPTLKYKKHFPNIEQNIYIANNAKIIGNISIKKDNKIFDHVVLRGDGEKISIGERCEFFQRCTVHVASDFLGTDIGNDCLFSEYTVIHACKIGNNVMVGENSVIMDGSIVDDYCIILPDSLIPPGKKFEQFSIISGTPAKCIKKIDKKFFNNFNKMKLKSKTNHSHFIQNLNSKFKNIVTKGKNIFIASDLFSNCKLIAHENSSIWFSTILNSTNNEGVVYLGKGSNIQDNSIINTNGEKVIIENRVTIGHNVIINGETFIGSDAVIGMGSILEKNCSVEDGGFVGAKSYLKKNTKVPKNHIFAGNPAKFFRHVTPQEKHYFSKGQKIYEKLTTEYLKNNN